MRMSSWKLVLSSLHDDDPQFEGDGYIGLCITYATFAVSLWLAPSVISMTGPCWAMRIASVGYSVFIAMFYTVNMWMIYIGSAVVGFSASVLWTGKGNYLFTNSDSDTIIRHSAVFWVIITSSSLYGNLFVYFVIQTTVITANNRNTIITGLLIIGVLATVLLLQLPQPIGVDGKPVVRTTNGPLYAFKRLLQMATSMNMVILSITFCFMGLELAFSLGIYTACVGFTHQLGSNSKQVASYVGMFIALGQFLGGTIVIVSGKQLAHKKWGRSGMLTAGFIFMVLFYTSVFINLPDRSVFGDTEDVAIINSSVPLVLMGSVLLGIGESFYLPHLFSLLSAMYPDDSAQSIALCYFISSSWTALSFFYSTYLGLYTQLAILITTGLTGALAFCYVDLAFISQQSEQNKEEKLRNTHLQ